MACSGRVAKQGLLYLIAEGLLGNEAVCRHHINVQPLMFMVSAHSSPPLHTRFPWFQTLPTVNMLLPASHAGPMIACCCPGAWMAP
jgi:hypothetical protein